VEFLKHVDDLTGRAGCSENAVEEEAPAHFLNGLIGIVGLQQFLEAAEVALLARDGIGEVGELHARPRLREIDVVLEGHLDEACIRRDSVEVFALALGVLPVGIRHFDPYRPEYADIARLSACIGERCVERGAMAFHAGCCAPRRELQFREIGAQRQSRARQSSLYDHRAVLGRGHRRKWTADAEVFALVIDAVDLGRIAEGARLTVHYDGIFLHAVPQRARDAEELLRAHIALVVLHHFIEAVVGGLVLVGRRDGVPRDPALGDVVERVEETGAVEGMMVRRRQGQREADAGCCARHQRNNR